MSPAACCTDLRWIRTGRPSFCWWWLTQAETDDPDRRVDVEVWPPTGDDAHHIEFELPEAAVAAEVGFAIFRIEVNLPVDGRWVLVVTGGAGTISLPLIVTG